MNSVQILVLDFGSQYTQLIARRLREYGIYAEIVPYFESIDSIIEKNPKGIILSGGPASVYDEGAYKPDSRIFELGLPILGICYGMQYIAHFFGGKVVRALSQEFGRAVLTILNKDSVSPTQILQTNRFIIRTFTAHDFKSLYELLSNEVVMQKLPTLNEQIANKWLNEQIASYKHRGYGMWAVIDKENGKMIGYAGFEKTRLKSNNAAQSLKDTPMIKDSIKGRSMAQDSKHSKIVESCEAKSRETFAKDSVIEVLQWNHIIDRSYQNSDSEEIANACFSYAFQNLYVNEIYLLAHKDNKMMRHIAQTFGAVECGNDEVIVWKINNSLESARNNDKKIIGDDLILRELVPDDLSDIESMLLDCEVMSAWGRALSKEEAKEWLSKQIQSYKLYGFGLFAVIEKSSGIMVGQCGITWQNVQDDELYNTIKSSISANDYLTQNNVEALLESKSPLLPELGYIFKKSYWHKGLANKAAQMCMDYAFQTLGLPLLISLIKTDNIAPQNVAKRLEMHIVGKTYKTFDGAYIPHFAYVMRASDYLGLNFKSPELKKVLLEFESFAPSDSTDNTFSNHASNSLQNSPMTNEVGLDILKIWRDSINATHHFLTQSDIESMENDIVKLLESTTVIIVSDYDKKIGFISLRGNKIEAIFVSPSAFKRGIGKELLKKALEFSLGDYDEIFVDCNEANADAISFYHSLGFEIFSRSSKDLQNRNLPLVHFRAKSLSLMREFDLHYNMPVFETDRLIVREMRQSDKGQLQTMLLDYEVMGSWEYNFNDSSVQEWLEVQLDRYEKFGFGLWAVVEKDSGQMIGQAGLSLQTYNGEKVLGMTYIIARKHWKKGYGVEVALGCKHYAFQVLKVRELYLLINESNEASKSVAKKLQAYLLGDTTWTYRSRSLQRLVYRIKNENVCKFSLETSRTTLRPYLDSDYPVLKEMLQDGETMKAWSGTLSERGVYEWIAKEQTNHDKFGIGWWVVVDRASGVVVGLTGLHYTQYLDTKHLELCYMLHKNHWHKGYAIEVVFACKEYAFRHLRAKRLYSVCREDNLAAQNVAQRVGMDRVGTTERDGINYVEFCAVSKVNPISYTKYIYTSMESLETLQKKIGTLGLRINALNIADSKEVLDLSSLWQEHFRRTHAHIPQEVVEQSGKNMQAMIKQSRQCLTISCDRQGVVENELFGFLILHDMDSSHSFIEIFLCTQKALMQKEGAILLQAFIHMNDSKYITIPVITTQEQRHFYENLGFTQQQDSEDIPHFAGTLPSNVISSLYYRYHDTEIPCFIYGMERMALSASLRSFLSKDKHFDLAEKIFSQSGDKQVTPRVETLFDNVGQDSIVWMSHADKVEVIPQGFVELAKSDNTHYCAIANFERQIYALQFHPEVVHSEYGGEILKNFALRICGADNSWNMKNFASLEIAKLRKKVLGCEFSDLDSKMDLSESLSNAESRADISEALLDSKSSKSGSAADCAGMTDLHVSFGSAESRVRENSKTGSKDCVNGTDLDLSAERFCDDFAEESSRTGNAAGFDNCARENSKICDEKLGFSRAAERSYLSGSDEVDECRIADLSHKAEFERKTLRQDSEGSEVGFCDDFMGCDDFETRSLLDINDKVEKSNSHKSAQKPTQKVLCAVSGGVDSSVVATLLYRAIGENLIPVFVDTGLLRKGEKEAVIAMFRENLKVPLIVVDASRLFLSRLKGVLNPEKKRKIIGETFIEVFEAEAKKHNVQGEIKFLAQGTLYPDVIESVSVKGPSKTIKSHHNVGGLPEWMKFELIEPLRELFKDEVRALGRELGMPESMLMRHPFPGPGLAIRIMGEVNEGDLELLREADSIFIEELRRAGLYNSVWQAFCVLLNVKSVGVMGDNRTYDNTICLRAVDAQDGMTASFSTLPHEFLESVSNRIINEVAGINRVVYDITSKPPGTIEWE